MRTVTLLTYHAWRTKRRAGFHHLANAFRELGWRVLFFTVGLSWLSSLTRDFRLEPYSTSERNRLTEEENSLYGYLHYTPWHSVGVNNVVVDAATAPFVKQYSRFRFAEAEQLLQESELMLFESSDGLLLFDQLKRLNPEARMVYRMSDLLVTLRKHPWHHEVERRILPQFDLVSVPSRYAEECFPQLPNLEVQFHGIDKAAFDRCTESPYSRGSNAVFVGSEWRLDWEALRVMAEAYPEVQFHLIGKLPQRVQAPNLVYHGEKPFAETVGFIKFADVGLLPFREQPHIRFFGDSSLKVSQCNYCGLPILVPEFLNTGWANAVTYKVKEPKSMAAAIAMALSELKEATPKPSLLSWAELTKILASEKNA